MKDPNMLVQEPAKLAPETRTCANCACSDIISRPGVQPPHLTPAEFDSMPARQMICRLNPPLVVQTPKGRALMQMPTDEKLVCWHWKAEGTLPGDNWLPIPWKEAGQAKKV